MSDLDDYVDLRELHPGYTTIPCKECSRNFHVQNSFAYTHDEWYCRTCKPENLREVGGGLNITVRL